MKTLYGFLSAKSLVWDTVFEPLEKNKNKYAQRSARLIILEKENQTGDDNLSRSFPLSIYFDRSFSLL